MVLNANKTKSMLRAVTGKRIKSQINGSGLDLQAGGVAIEQVMHQKLLRVPADEELTFKEHVDQLCKNVSPEIGLLNKMRTYLLIRERELFYNALIKPTIMYDLNRILRLQKRSAPITLGVDSRSRTVENFKKRKWLPFYDDAKINKCVLLYNALRGESPTYINDLPITNKSVHGRETKHG